ncbi:unnamed protein product [Periconia digitata]|uniref:Cytochrome P450 n=1 Tax=Periconia digitata TaxID=1303443 RepID=A0A9W4XMW1_9PLEO|nr:unnamed protein product [Periconia digitata]
MGLLKSFVTVGTPFASMLIYVFYIGYQKRSRIYRLSQQGVAMPDGWSWWFGHLLVLDQKLEKLPHDANVHIAMEDMIKDYEDTGYFLMDYWPVFEPVLMAFSPEISAQVSSKQDLLKPPSQEESFKPMVGGPSLITMIGTPWKFWRSLFSSGFSPSHMLSLVPGLVDTMDVFCERLLDNVDGDIFYLDDMAMPCRASTCPLSEYYSRLAFLLESSNPSEPAKASNPMVPWAFHGYFHQKELQKRFNEMKEERATNSSYQRKTAKSVIALAIEEHISQKHKDSEETFEDLDLDAQFADIAANQIRMFLFAGNDTTATTFVYTFHLLSQNPSSLDKLRKEHDGVFKSELDAGDQLRKEPALIIQCRYTLAVIKETLRLFPPASAIRDGTAGISVVDGKGNLVPTENLNVTAVHHYVHVHPRFWPRARDFIPERWLVEPRHELYPTSPTTSYRPFEHGPRNCIAQTLVNNELRVAVIMTARKFDIKPAYDEWDSRRSEREGTWTRTMRTLCLKGEEPKTVLGERAYQTARSGAHPADRYPCRVSLANP